MTSNATIDGVLIEWGERLFYPGNRTVKAQTPRLQAPQDRAAAIRSHIEATVRRAPQVMVRVTGGGRGMAAIAAHFRYITKNGRLDIEDDRGVVERGKDAVREIERQWEYGGARIEREGYRREAFNIMLSMPRGTDSLTVQRAAREFAKLEFADHRYVMVLHDHQANPHVHLSVKAESKHGRRLNPRKADLQRWREVFAERLRERGIDAEATRQATRGEFRHRDTLWQRKAKEAERLQAQRPSAKSGAAMRLSREGALQAWKRIGLALAHSDKLEDRKLARQIIEFVKGCAVRRVKGALAPGCARPGLGAARGAADSMGAGPRSGPLVEVRPAPGYRARTQSHRRRERAIGDQAVDGGAAQTGRCEHSGQAREQAWRCTARRRHGSDGGPHRHDGIWWPVSTLGAASARSAMICDEKSSLRSRAKCFPVGGLLTL
jgi:hypothetical protein